MQMSTAKTEEIRDDGWILSMSKFSKMMGGFYQCQNSDCGFVL
jgi:hypothetical protein